MRVPTPGRTRGRCRLCSGDDPAIDRGTLLHRNGRLLAAEGRRDAAQDRFTAALRTFAGAGPHEARVLRDLDALGETAVPIAVPQWSGDGTGPADRRQP